MAWLAGWNRRKPKLVRGSTAGVQTNYQLKLTIYKGAGTDTDNTIYLGGYVNNDFSDLRFTSSDETTLLPYWIESYISGVSAVVWIKIDSIPADPFTKFIYIYYNRPSVISTSNGTNTFIFFDDFLGSSLSASWVCGARSASFGAGSCSVANSIVTVIGGSNTWWGAYASGVGAIPVPFSIESLAKIILTSQPAGGVIAVSSNGKIGEADATNIGTGFSNGYSTVNNGAITSQGAIPDLSTFKIVRMDISTAKVEFYENDILKSTVISNIPDAPMSAMITAAQPQGITSADWIFIRKFSSPEPVFSTTSTEQIYTANLTVSSTPSGAEIWINNIDQGVTTTSWFILNPGTYTITITKAGYQDYNEIITLSSNQNAIVQGNLISSTGNLDISSTPSGAQIWIDGSYIGYTTPNTITGLSPGSHTYQLRLSGYYDNPFPPGSFTITGEQTTIIPIITMILIIGAIDISSTPSNAEIWLAPTGSPLAYQGVTTPAIIGGLTPAIQYTYELRLIDYYPKSGTFILIDGETITRSEILDLLPCPESLRYEGNTVTLQATPKDGTGPYYVEFRKGGVAISGNDPLGRPYTIPVATENTLLIRTYVLTNEDIRTAYTGIINFEVYMEDSCPTGVKTCTDTCTITIGCYAPVCNFTVT